MRINSVHLASFGKFKNYTLNFSDGFNVIFGENEKGKTTIMAFIRMMFYGTSGKSSDTAKNLRKKYMPFDSDLMAGSIDFEHKGVSYTLERVFKTSNAADKLKLINHNTGEINSTSGKTDIGSAFFGLSDSAFEKSVYIGNLSVFSANEDADGELNSKLSNIVTSLDESVSLEEVKARLIKAKELLMSRSGKIGIYDKAQKKLEETERLLMEAERREESILSTQTLISEKQARQEVVSKESARLFELLKNAKKLSLKAALDRYFNSCEVIDKLEEKIMLSNGHPADKTFLNQLKTAHLEAEQLKRELALKEHETEKAAAALELLKGTKDTDILSLKEEKQMLESELEKLRLNIAFLLSKENELGTKSKSTKPKRTAKILLSGLGWLITAVGLGLGFVSSYLFLVSLLGVIILVFGGLLIRKTDSGVSAGTENKESVSAKLDAERTRESELCSKIEALNNAINTVLVESGSRKALIEAKTIEFLDLKESLLSAKENVHKTERELDTRFSHLKNSGQFNDILDAVDIIDETLSRIDAEKVKLSMSYEQTGCSSREEAKSRLAELNTDSELNNMSSSELESAQRKIKEISEEKNRLGAEIAALKQELKNLLSSGDTVSVLRLKVDKMKQNLDKQKAFCDSVDLSVQALEEAFSELRHSFSRILEGKTAEIFSSLTGGAYTSVNVSKNFEIGVTAKDSFGTKEWQYLSLGTAQQAYFALRLALAELINEDNSRLPLLLDDSLSEYDDSRSLVAMEFLKEYSKSSQTILFTCHSGIANMAKSLDLNIKNL